MTALELFGYFLTGLTLISVGVWVWLLAVILRDTAQKFFR